MSAIFPLPSAHSFFDRSNSNLNKQTYISVTFKVDLELELCYKLRLGLLRDLNSESGSGFVTARATHAWDDGHVGSWPDPWVCETDKFKT